MNDHAPACACVECQVARNSAVVRHVYQAPEDYMRDLAERAFEAGKSLGFALDDIRDIGYENFDEWWEKLR
jgi:hypothetical protein